jgi:hypothetical protein
MRIAELKDILLFNPQSAFRLPPSPCVQERALSPAEFHINFSGADFEHFSETELGMGDNVAHGVDLLRRIGTRVSL